MLTKGDWWPWGLKLGNIEKDALIRLFRSPDFWRRLAAKDMGLGLDEKSRQKVLHDAHAFALGSPESLRMVYDLHLSCWTK